MSKLFLTAAVLFTVAGAATAQSPAPAGQFRPVGSTGKLLTSESRDYWKKMGRKLQVAEATADAVTDKLGLPHVNPLELAAAATQKATAATKGKASAPADEPARHTGDKEFAARTLRFAERLGTTSR